MRVVDVSPEGVLLRVYRIRWRFRLVLPTQDTGTALFA